MLAERRLYYLFWCLSFVPLTFVSFAILPEDCGLCRRDLYILSSITALIVWGFLTNLKFAFIVKWGLLALPFLLGVLSIQHIGIEYGIWGYECVEMCNPITNVFWGLKISIWQLTISGILFFWHGFAMGSQTYYPVLGDSSFYGL